MLSRVAPADWFDIIFLRSVNYAERLLFPWKLRELHHQNRRFAVDFFPLLQ